MYDMFLRSVVNFFKSEPKTKHWEAGMVKLNAQWRCVRTQPNIRKEKEKPTKWCSCFSGTKWPRLRSSFVCTFVDFGLFSCYRTWKDVNFETINNIMPLHSVIYCAFYSTEIIMFYSAPKNISVIGPMIAASIMSGGNRPMAWKATTIRKLLRDLPT